MFSNSINKEELSDAAKEFLSLLEKYQVNHQPAKNVLNRSRVLIERAINGQIETPMPNGFFPEEFWEGRELFQYNDLGNAVANFSLLLKGAESINKIKTIVQDIEKKAASDEAELLKKLKG
jgi:hypothetical protein